MSKSYPGSIDRRPSGSWRWRGCIDGDRVQTTWKPEEVEAEARPHESLEDTVERLAREEYDELTGEMHRPESGDMALSAFLKQFEREEVAQLAESSQRAYGATLDALRTYLVDLRDDPRLRNLGQGDVKRFLNWRRTHGADGTERKALSDYTLQREYAVLRRVLGHAHELELIPGNPADRVDPPKVEEREPVLLTDEQVVKLLGECAGKPMLRMYVLLLSEAGLRSGSEATWLKWEDIDLEDGFLQVVSGRGERQTKNRKGRWVPMTSRLREELREHAAKYRMQLYGNSRSPWVLHHVSPSNRWGEPGDRRKSFQTALSSAAERAGLPEEWRPHDLRHRRCTKWLAEGHSPALVRKAMGHSSLDVTLQYEHLVRRDLEGMVEEEERRELAAMKG